MSVRSKLAQAADEDYEMIRTALRDGIESKKEIWVTCRACNKKTSTTVNDQTSVNRVVDIWLNQGFGREVQDARASQGDDVNERLRQQYADMTADELRTYIKHQREKAEIVEDLSADQLRALVANRVKTDDSPGGD